MNLDRLVLYLLNLTVLALGWFHVYPGYSGLILVYWINARLTWICIGHEYGIRVIFSTVDLGMTLSQTITLGQGVNRVQEDVSLSVQLCICL